MKLYLKDCINNMDKEESTYYYNKSASDYFRYIYSSDEYKIAMMRLNLGCEDKKDWKYIFEKLYITTYKSLTEEKKTCLSYPFYYAISKIGMLMFNGNTLEYNESYRLYELIKSVYRNKEIDNFLLKILEEVMQEYDVDKLNKLIDLHINACVLRNNRDYFYRESNFGNAEGLLTQREREAINSFNRSYEREKSKIKKISF